MRPDLVIDNANFITVDDSRPRAGSLAVVGSRIVAVGDAGEFVDAGARRLIDLEGRTVVPGFNDAHNHMGGYGATLNEVAIQPEVARSIEEIVAAIGARAEATPEGVWVIGTGYNDNKLAERRHPTRQELDAVSPDNPVLLNHTSGHFCVVNTAAMRLARVGEVAVPEGGVVALGDDGTPNGLLEEQAQTLARALLHPRAIADMVENLGAASDRYLSEGITSCQEAGVGGILGTSEPLELAAYQEARRSGRLRVRVTLMPAVETLHSSDHHEDDDEPFALDLGMHSGFGDEWLKFGAVKIFADGSLIGRTAAMFEDFEGEPGNNGYFQMDEAKLHNLIFKAHRSGWQVATHAIGDRAVSSVLDALEEAQRRRPREGTRHRIEHCGMCKERDVARIAAMGVIPIPQARFISEIGDGMARAIGSRRGDCYRQRSFLDAGVVVPGSSDRPVVNGAPLLGIHDLVNQMTADGEPFNPHEALTPEESIRAYTLSSAYAAFDERDKGSLEVGKLADLTVLDQDITTIDPDAIAATNVVATMVGGNFEFDQLGLA
ncbi:MAG: putative amidohydrolase YtcJ [Acidimicrobiales bacterium]|jgi:predicted amidohydrolase YtcJ